VAVWACPADARRDDRADPDSFQRLAEWDPNTQSLIEVVKPVTAQMSGADIPHGQIRASAS
jgi:hypothetical protein